MNKKESNWSRRKFITVGSAALIASPLLVGTAKLFAMGVDDAPKASAPGAAAKGTKIYKIGEGCVGCQACRTFCPAQAIRFGNCGNEIDQRKCQHCGACYRECNISVISETTVE